MNIQKRVEEYKNEIIRINHLKKKMIDAEISWTFARDYLELTQYEFILLRAGKLKEKEEILLELIETTPASILNRNKEMKEFQKALIDKGLKVSDVLKSTKMTKNKLYRTLNNIRIEPDRTAQKKIEEAVGIKIFH